MEAKHTPGPWNVSPEYSDGWLMVMASGKIVANVNPESFSAGVADLVGMPCEANAHLIAAAPELLESLRELVAYCEETGNDWMCVAKARDAIAKATGAE